MVASGVGDPHQSPRPDSGQGEEELLHGLGVYGIGAVRLSQTLFEAAGHYCEASPVQGMVRRGELGDDVVAVAAVLDHAQDAADLALGAAQAVGHGAHVFGVQRNHCGSLDVVARGRCMRSLSCYRPAHLSAGACVSAMVNWALISSMSSSRTPATTGSPGYLQPPASMQRSYPGIMEKRRRKPTPATPAAVPRANREGAVSPGRHPLRRVRRVRCDPRTY